MAMADTDQAAVLKWLFERRYPGMVMTNAVKQFAIDSGVSERTLWLVLSGGKSRFRVPLEFGLTALMTEDCPADLKRAFEKFGENASDEIWKSVRQSLKPPTE